MNARKTVTPTVAGRSYELEVPSELDRLLGGIASRHLGVQSLEGWPASSTMAALTEAYEAGRKAGQL